MSVRFALLAVVFALVCHPAGAKAPNVVLVLADDLGIGDVSYMQTGGRIATKTIDRLARRGRTFLDARAPGSVCTPTRYSLLTGRFSWRTWMQWGVAGPYASSLIEQSRPTIAKWFQRQGYKTALVGKWHLGIDWRTRHGDTAPPHQRNGREQTLDLSRPYANGPLDAGFDVFFGVDAPNYPPYAFISQRRIEGETPTRQKPDHVYGKPGLMQEGWDVDRVFAKLADKALATLDELASGDAPFFLFLPLTGPHTPISPSPAFRGRSGVGPYGDFVQEIDVLMGRIERTLRRHGKLRDTILVFTSDNGSPGRYESRSPPGSIVERTGHRPNGELRGSKATPYEGGHRIPLFIHWPGGGVGGVSQLPVSLIQLWPTLADLIGRPLKSRRAAPDAVSFASDLDPTLPPHRQGDRGLYGTSLSGLRSLRSGAWKLIWGLNGFELYDLSTDPGEAHDLARARPAIVFRLSRQMIAIGIDRRPRRAIGPKARLPASPKRPASRSRPTRR